MIQPPAGERKVPVAAPPAAGEPDGCLDAAHPGRDRPKAERAAASGERRPPVDCTFRQRGYPRLHVTLSRWDGMGNDPRAREGADAHAAAAIDPHRFAPQQVLNVHVADLADGGLPGDMVRAA